MVKEWQREGEEQREGLRPRLGMGTNNKGEGRGKDRDLNIQQADLRIVWDG